MKLTYILPYFFMSCCFAAPFYAEDKLEPQHLSTQQASTFVKNPAELTACHTTAIQSLYLNTTFNRLKLIGIAHIHDEFHALFLDEQQKIIGLKKGFRLEPESIEIYDIDFKQLRYIDWQSNTDCHHPIIRTLPF